MTEDTMHVDSTSNSPQGAGPGAPPDPWRAPGGSDAPESWGGSCGWRPHRHDRIGRAVMGLTLAAWGLLLLLRELGYLPASVRGFDFWPVLLVGAGISILLRRRSLFGALAGVIVGGLGVVFLAERLGYAVPRAGLLWPVLVIVGGLSLVFRSPRWHRRPYRAARDVGLERSSADLLQRSVTMGGLKLSVDSQAFRGAALSVTMGGVQVDLRRAAMAGDEAPIDLAVFMGGLELWVPPSWIVSSEVSPLLGAVEDRTDPVPDSTSGVQKRLVLRGTLTMGAVTVRN